MSILIRIITTGHPLPKTAASTSYGLPAWRLLDGRAHGRADTPNLPAKIIPTKIARLKTSGIFPMDRRVQPLEIKRFCLSQAL